MLCIISAAKEWEHLLRGGHANEPWTDHESLTYFFKQPQLSSRQHRWNAYLEPLRLHLKYIPGRVNLVADALSWYSIPRSPAGQAGQAAPAAQLGIVSTSDIDPELMSKLQGATASDTLCVDIRKDILAGNPGCFSEARGLLFLQEGGKAPRLYVPTMELRTKVLKECHDTPIAGHLGRDKTLEAVSRLLYWPNLRTDVLEYVET